jgi:integrase
MLKVPESSRKSSSKFSQLLGRVNERLKVASLRVRVEVVGESLYLRAMVPLPPIGSEWRQRRIPLRLKAVAAHLLAAENAAKALAGELAAFGAGFGGGFDWAKWGMVDAKSPIEKTIGDWVEELIRDRERTGLQPCSIRAYRRAFNRLPLNQPLSVELLKEELQKPALLEHPRTQLLCCQKFGQLAEFAGVPVDLRSYRGSYSPESLTERTIPDRDRVIEAWNSVKNPGWRWVLGLLIVFGVRNHEVFYLDISDMVSGGHSVFVSESKTGPHTAWAMNPEDVDLFELRAAPCLPRVTFDTHEKAGRRVTKYLNREFLGGFSPYDLRHLWAIQTGVGPNRLPLAVAAQAQGHSQKTHEATYQRWISPEVQRLAYLAAHGYPASASH